MSRPLLARTVVRRKASSTANRISGAASILMRPITAFPTSPIPPAPGPSTAPVRPPRTMASKIRPVGERRRVEALDCCSAMIGSGEGGDGIRPPRAIPSPWTFRANRGPYLRKPDEHQESGRDSGPRHWRPGRPLTLRPDGREVGERDRSGLPVVHRPVLVEPQDPHPKTRPPRPEPQSARAASSLRRPGNTWPVGCRRPLHPASAYLRRQQGHSLPLPFTNAWNAVGCGSVVMARNARGARWA